jgi:hypothetical protein
VEEAMKQNSKDNVTALVLFLHAKGQAPRRDTSCVVKVSNFYCVLC